MSGKIRTEGDLIHITEWLLPLSWIYGLIVTLRNKLFEIGVLKERSFSIPVISVGNITVGGSGKTPHVEYLIRLLSQYVQVGVLSRGYKRRTRGYRLTGTDTPACEVGDEPYQMKCKFPHAYVAVDHNRCRGIDRMTQDEATANVDVILLDDAFQHRYVKPGINILLVDYHRLIIYDKMLPAGRLREPLSGKRRADMVIVTKCPKDLKPMEYRVLTKALDLYPYQQLYFTTIHYGQLYPAFENGKPVSCNMGNGGSFSPDSIRGKVVLLITGIASPKQMENDLRPHCRELVSMSFADHHNYTAADAQRINETYSRLTSPAIIITTEKDMTRLETVEELSPEVKAAMNVLPITIGFMLEQEEIFNQNIISYVRKNSRNSILAKVKDDHKSKDRHHTGNRTGTISFRNN